MCWECGRALTGRQVKFCSYDRVEAWQLAMRSARPAEAALANGKFRHQWEAARACEADKRGSRDALMGATARPVQRAGRKGEDRARAASAGAKTRPKLTFKPDHQSGADHGFTTD
jgi:hypothetical protein